ncbi:hypothetical protein [Amycolatopsis sp. PS_44_ISF1]|uniref:hypothetical protein n=1 Tax=Amycolatopsis sp. PS_44_ISF1 TaxID=2974917 RepID=UPI0028DE50C6|nr:hypothetical protein [Amycolatopsis sp. PS_44_ISF1]MDT8912408.1 hypothetical protein [Amycolatopsis sp. PS_44_ISF1]
MPIANAAIASAGLQGWSTGDCEPGPQIRLLVQRDETGAPRWFLARFQHGWVWARRCGEVGHTTPLTWRWAMSAEHRHPVRVGIPTDEEISVWQSRA